MSTVLYFVVALIGFFVLMQVYIRLSGFLKKGKVVPDFEGEVGKKIKSGQRLLLYFYSPSCAACRPMTPVIDRMLQERKNIVKLNVQHEFTVARHLGVMATPAVVLIENRRINQFVLGARREGFLRKLI
jgi:thioredoxin 1